MNKITIFMLLLIGMLTGNCIVSAAHTDKNTRNLRGWDQEQEFISLGWNGGTPGECETGVAWRNCGPNATCWRTYRNGNWNGNGICVPDGQCLPRNTWATAGAVGVSQSRMERDCCNGARCVIMFHTSYCICL